MALITPETPLKFLNAGGVSPNQGFKWKLPTADGPGEWMRDYKTKPLLCQRGWHWCEARHSLGWLAAECYVIEPRGVIVQGDDKNVSQGARLLRRVDAWNETTARLFAADCAEAVVHLCGDDPRPRAAIDTARRFARGTATRDELAAAGAAARDAAWAAARDAARDAAWAARAAQVIRFLQYLNGEIA